MWKFTLALAGLISQHDNSIWAFIVRNAYRPAMLKGRFDFVVGNPPWLSYRYISDPAYQQEVKRWAVEEYKIAPKAQRLMTQMELATVFLAHGLTTFAKSGGRLGFVMPRSLFSADQHAAIRKGSYAAKFSVTAIWDLWDVEPLFRVPACVVFAEKWPELGEIAGQSDRVPVDRTEKSLPMVVWKGKLQARDVSWPEAEKTLLSEPTSARVIYLGHRTAWSATPGRTAPNEPSPYAAEFRQGATLVPRNFYFVRVRDLPPAPAPDTEYAAETDPEQARQAKAPYREVRLSGMVPGKYLYATALAGHVLPFVVLPPATVALPLERRDSHLALLTAEDLRKKGDRGFAEWMRKAEAIWDEKRDNKAEAQDVYERLDYQKGLTAQKLLDRHLVLFNRSGTNVSAAHLDRATLSLSFIVDFSLYWAMFRTGGEANYLTVILNCGCVNDAIKPFQSTGLMGERDITMKLLDLPIPRYDPADPRHHELAELGQRAQDRAATAIRRGKLPKTLAARRAMIRDTLRDLLQAMDEIVRTLF